MSNRKLKNCPFCGRVPKIVPCDDEGNLHLEAGYEENPWSGLGYQIMHQALTDGAAEDCPIASFKGETIGTNIYDTREEAIATWNRQPHTQVDNKPLTVAELLEVSTQHPVWLVGIGDKDQWVRIDYVESLTIGFSAFCDAETWSFLTEHFGKTVFAYRHPPEKEGIGNAT